MQVRRVLIEHSIFFFFAAAYFAWRAFLLEAVVQQPFWGGGLWPTLLTMSKCFVLYLRNVFVPPPTNCLDYAVPISHSLLKPAAFGSVVALFLFLGLTFLMWRVVPVAGYGLVWFLIGLLPVANLFPITQLMAERFLYLPLAGISVTAASLLTRLEGTVSKTADTLARTALVAAIMAFGFCTIAKNSAWRDLETLMLQSLHRYPNSFNMRMDLGAIYHQKGRYLDALKQHELALQASPDDWKVPYVLCNMGDAYRAMGDYGSAIASYQAALSIVPDLADARMNLGITYLRQGRQAEAARSFERAVQIDPRLSVVVRAYLSGAHDKGVHSGGHPEQRMSPHSP